MRKIVAVDVDLTVVDTLNPWLEWVHRYTYDEKVKNESGQYDLVPEMKELLKRADNQHIDPFEFWRDARLYDDLQPLSWSVLGLYGLHTRGYGVVFVSSCVPEHMCSKERFLRKWFPFHNGFIATHDKHLVDYDVLIDDKLEHIINGQNYRPQAEHFLFTGVRHDGGPRERALRYNSLDSWGDINTKLGF